MPAAAHGVRLALLGAAVALAFADSSIVVLALPELMHVFDASVTGVSWVVTSYNLVVAVVAAVLAFALRVKPATLTRVGLVIFLGSSLGCAFSPTLGALVAFRSLQGVGGAALLAGALPLARALARTPQRGAALWAGAAATGTAVGPAAGGALTHAFDWRAIFLAQAPVAVLALVGARGHGELQAALRTPTAPAPRIAANAGLALVSAALVGALFLAVILLVNVWELSPLAAAAVVSAIPAAATLAGVVARGGGGVTSVTCGAVLLAGGLVGMALLPSRSLGWVLAALVLCGAGIGVTVPPLTELALAGSAQPDAAGTWTVASRHAGLVAGLVLLTPLLARDLVAAAGRAERAGAAVVLDAPLSLESKVPLAVDLAREIERTPRGSLPSFDREFARRQAAAGDERPALIDLHRALDATVLAVVTRSFRRAFVLAALVALLALTALPFVGGRSHA